MLYQLRNVRQIYEGRTVLTIDSLNIQAGEILAIVGPSGAGKSTLLRLLALLEAPSRGHVKLFLNEAEYTQSSVPIEIRRQIAMVFQRPILLSRSVRANVAYGLNIRGKRKNVPIVDDVLKRLAIHQLERAKPNTLSGGEMQRVAMARAMVLEPDVLILDEPTGNLDPQNIRIIENFLLEQHRESATSIIIVTHNIFQAKRLADRVALIYDGELIEVADTESFFEKPKDERSAAFTSGHLIY
jgi:tungstate transport system ATP-binding protein